MESELIRIIVNGKEERVEMLSNVYIDVKGNKEVGLGSGFSQEERIRFFKNPSLIIGHKIKVKYFEETIDTKTGKPSLRFPIYLGIRDIVE
jgi:DNA ligase-1